MRLLAGAAAVFLATLLALTTPWARSVLLDQASAGASGRFGVDIRAARLDYRLASLAVTLEDVAITDRAAGQPFFRAERVEIDLAASALRGRLDLDRIYLLRPTIVLDSTTRPPPRAERDSAQSGATDVPPFDIGLLEVEGLDFTAGDTQDTRVVVRQVTSTLHGRGSRQLEGDLAALGGVDLTFETDDVRVGFERAQARIVLDGSRRLITGVLTASSPVADLRAEGNLRVGRDGEYDLRYDAQGRLDQLGRWWQAAPDWQGPITLQGQVRGPLKRPDATIAAKATDLRWLSLRRTALDATGLVSADGLVLDALSLTSPQGTLQGRGRFSFRTTGRSELDVRWRDLDGTVLTGLVPVTAVELPRAYLSGSALLTWPGRLPTTSTTEGKLETTAIAVAPETTATGTLAADGRAGRWQVSYRQSLEGLTLGSLDAEVVVDPDHLARSPLTGTDRAARRHSSGDPRATAAPRSVVPACGQRD